ncbi:phage antirepressor [Prescottella equi]|uniref:phage antirepressor n=1 Tax=Rhodococcus hoagii TaxID=43767 RepID=UPI001EEE49C1|nr:phage antirepressor KilAC domain-containing protein [Prescottella equi]
MSDATALAASGESFQYETTSVRTVDIDGRRWAVAADICRVLDIKDVRRAVSRLDEADRLSTPIRSGSQNRNMLVVSEDGATDLVLESRKPEAKKFRRFLTHEVWPSIRDTGSYSLAPALTGPELMARALVEAKQVLAAKDATIAELAPKAAYVDEFVADEDLIQFRTLANQLQIGEAALRETLIEHRWIYRVTGSRWSNSKGRKETIHQYRAFAEKKPYFRLRPLHKAPRVNGEVQQTLLLTPAGAEAVARNLARWTESAA